jgi:hypothetical protein
MPLTFQFNPHIPSSKSPQHPPEPFSHLEDAAVMFFYNIPQKLHHTL